MYVQCTYICTCTCTSVHTVILLCVLGHTECGSAAFDEFLKLLGDKVKMKGFTKYRAQLDHKSMYVRHYMFMEHVPIQFMCVFVMHFSWTVHVRQIVSMFLLL